MIRNALAAIGLLSVALLASVSVYGLLTLRGDSERLFGDPMARPFLDGGM